MDIRIILILVLSCFQKTESEEVVDFGDISLSTVDDASAAIQDNKNTGSYLFKIENDLEKEDRISLNIQIKDLMPSGSAYLRTHPAFVTCLQKIITYVQNNNEGYKVKVTSGYKTLTEIGSSTKVQDVYAAAGTGAVLSVTDGNGVAADLKLLAQAGLRFCPTIFAAQRQYIGIVMLSSGVHIHMTGSVETPRGPHFSVDGFTEQTTSEFKTWAEQKLNEALDPVASPDCSTSSALSNGATYPNGLTIPKKAVGSADSVVSNKADYTSRLVIYPGHNLNYIGTGELLMAPRMYDVIRKLQFLVRNNGDKLKIEKLFAAEADSLHLEGREALVKMTTDNSATKLSLLSKLALCAGADFVKNQGDKVIIAVKKQSSIEAKRMKFPQGELLKVKATADMQTKLGSDVDEDENWLYDGEFQGEKYVSELSQLKDYMSDNSRYLRLNPAIVQCYDNLLRHDKKWNSGAPVEISITHSFLTSEELYKKFDPNQDPRGDAFNRGEALLLKYGPGLDPKQYDIHRIVKTAIFLCGPVFNDLDTSMAIGVGIYDSEVYIDIRETFELWFGDSIILPEGVNQGDYLNSVEELFENAIIGRVVNPEDPIKACANDEVPQKQSLDYKYKHPAHIQGKRKKRQAGNVDESCTVERNTEFCKKSENDRNKQIEYLWEQINRLHIPTAFEKTLKTSLDQCFGMCGTCLLGEVYEDKVEHCSNLLHWLNFNLMNEEVDVTNFYHLGNFDTRKHACKGAGRHCLFNAPLFAILASSVYNLFRPDPHKSIEEELYGATDNPSPIIELIYDIYAITANGTITVWVNDEEEIKFLRKPLKVAMLYNKNVTNVKVLVVKQESVEDVGLAIEAMIATWVSTACPLHSRQIIAPYAVQPLPTGHVKKRDTHQYDQFSFEEQLLLRRHHWERHWADSVTR